MLNLSFVQLVLISTRDICLSPGYIEFISGTQIFIFPGFGTTSTALRAGFPLELQHNTAAEAILEVVLFEGYIFCFCSGRDY